MSTPEPSNKIHQLKIPGVFPEIQLGDFQLISPQLNPSMAGALELAAATPLTCSSDCHNAVSTAGVVPRGTAMCLPADLAAAVPLRFRSIGVGRSHSPNLLP